MLSRVQRGLESLYRIETGFDVTDFLIDERTRDELGTARSPREQLLVSETDGELELALFLDARAVENLTRHDPNERLDDRNLQDFLLAVEGVSHFVYVVYCARRERPVSALELELQAEVDKYVTCLLTLWPDGASSPPVDLRSRLFERFELEPDLDVQERARYLLANASARSYAASLEERFVMRRGVPDMLEELRRFYRLGVREKLEHIAKAA